MTGVEICRQVRQHQETTGADYTYLLLTSRDKSQDVVEGMEAGADDYLTKPCDLDELQARVRAGQRILNLQEKLLKTQQELFRQATHDALTGIWNRRAIMDTLQREIDRAQREAQPLSIVMGDVDYFKRINDTLGHAAGDQVLHEVAHRIQSMLRTYDSVGRYGGEEFLVVLPRCSQVHAIEIAERIRHHIQATPVQYEAESISISMSLGVSTGLLGSRLEGKTLVEEADTALYQAKSAGRNRVVVHAHQAADSAA